MSCLIENSKANILVCEDSATAESVLACREDLPHLKKIVVYPHKRLSLDHPDVMGWDQVWTIAEFTIHVYLKSVSRQINMRRFQKWKPKTGNWSYLDWFQLLHLGNACKNNSSVIQRHRSMAINQCAKLIYTSGTTGNPKGVLLNLKIIIFHFE